MARRSAGEKVCCLPEVPGTRPAGELCGPGCRPCQRLRPPPSLGDSTWTSPRHCSSPGLCGRRSGPCSLKVAHQSLQHPGSSEPSNTGQLLGLASAQAGSVRGGRHMPSPSVSVRLSTLHRRQPRPHRLPLLRRERPSLDSFTRSGRPSTRLLKTAVPRLDYSQRANESRDGRIERASRGTAARVREGGDGAILGRRWWTFDGRPLTELPLEPGLLQSQSCVYSP